MAKYFINPQTDEITLRFAYHPDRDDMQLLADGQEAPEGYDAQWVTFRKPGWGDEVELIEQSSRPTEAGEIVLDPIMLLENRVRLLLKAWSWAEPIEQLDCIDPRIMMRVAVELGRRV